MNHPLASLSTAFSPLLGNLKIDQIAFASNSERMSLDIMATLNLSAARWTEDLVTAEGFVHPFSGLQVNKARLLFNYDLGIELEILQYVEGANYVSSGLNAALPAMCHIGMHIPAGGERIRRPFRGRVVQDVMTTEHTNPGVGDRRYHYTIYDVGLGVFLKTIQRLEAK